MRHFRKFISSFLLFGMLVMFGLSGCFHNDEPGVTNNFPQVTVND